MKIKLDFVTNSSSTSFCAWGTCIEIKDIPDKLRKDLYNKHLARENDNITYEQFINSLDVLEELQYIFRDSGFYCLVDREDWILYFGRDPEDMKDNMTLGEFKKPIVDKLKELGLDTYVYFICEEINY
jgi:hypothetical protein